MAKGGRLMKKQLSMTIAAALASVLLLAGCAGNKPAATGTNEPSTVKTGGTLNIALSAEPPKMDPMMSSSLYDRQVYQSIYDKLVDMDENGKIVPMLAEKWDISDDKKTYVFKLRQGVKFHDGTDLNAEAVKFTFDRNMQKSSVRRGELAEVDKVSVVDTSTVKVELKQPFAPFLSVLTDRAGMIVSPTAVKKYGDDYTNNPVGTGPFIFKERVKGTSVTVEKNPNYWQKGLPKLDKVVYKVFTDSNVALANLKSGQVDMIDKFPYKEIEGMKNDPKITVINQPGFGYQGIFLNTSKPPFNKKELRQAVDLLVDRDSIVKVVLNGAGTPAHSPFAPKHFAYGETDKAEKPDVNKAKELLKQAGMPEGFTFTLKISTTPTNALVGQMLQNMLKPAGINVNLEKVEYGTLLEQSEKGNMEASALGWSGRPDPDQNIYDFYVTDGSQNDSRISNANIDKLLKSARTESEESKRKALYDQIMNALHEEAPYVYFYHEHNVFGVSKSVDGYKYVPDGLIRPVNMSKK